MSTVRETRASVAKKKKEQRSEELTAEWTSGVRSRIVGHNDIFTDGQRKIKVEPKIEVDMEMQGTSNPQVLSVSSLHELSEQNSFHGTENLVNEIIVKEEVMLDEEDMQPIVTESDDFAGNAVTLLESNEDNNLEPPDNKVLESSQIEAFSNLVTKSVANLETGKLVKPRAIFQPHLQTEKEDERALMKLFTAEMWKIILQNLIECTATTLKIYNSSAVFQAIFRKLAGETNLHFKLTLPMLCDYLYKKDVQASLLVCKSWSSSVNWTIENYFVLGNHTLRAAEPQPYNPYKLGSAVTSGGWREDSKPKTKFTQEILIPQNTAFIDFSNTQRIVSVKLYPDENTITEFSAFLRNSKTSLRHLTLQITHEHFNPAEVYDFCYQSLEECKNLSSLCIQYDIQYENENNKTEMLEENLGSKEAFPDHANLEHLNVELQFPNLLPIQDRLILKYAKQLRSLKIYSWSQTGQNDICWNSLTKLEVMVINSEHVLQDLATMRAPKLKELRINAERILDPDLLLLLKIISNFSELQSLIIQFPESFHGWSDQTILDLPIDAVRTNKLAALEIRVENSKDFHHDFLMCFPVLQTLVIHYDSLFLENIHKNESQNADFVKLGKYFRWTFRRLPRMSRRPVEESYYKDNLKDIYQSNIWDLLPRLKQLVEIWQYGKTYKKNVFTRQAYDWENKEKIYRMERHLEKIRKSAKEAKLESKKLRIVPMASKIKKTVDPSMALKIVAPSLDKENILNCRVVCKKWQKALELYVEEEKPDNFVYTFSIPLDSTESRHNKYLNDMKYHPQNPLIGNTVKIYFTESVPNNMEAIVKDCETLFKKIGNFIKNVIIEGHEQVVLSPKTYYLILRAVMKMTSVKSLRLEEMKVIGNDLGSGYQSTRPKWTFRTGLKKLEINIIDKDFEEVQFRLLEAYGKQLTHLRVESFGVFDSGVQQVKGVYHQLKELHVTTQNMRQNSVSDLLKQLEAPQLEKLSLVLGDTEPTADELVTFCSSLSHLNTLELYFAQSFSGLKNKSLLYLDSSLASVKVKNVKLVMGDAFQVPLDFLVYFPFLTKLSIYHGKWITHWNNLDNLEKVVANDNNGDETTRRNKNARNTDNDFIQLAKYIGKSSIQTEIYSSNMWKSLRVLQTLDIIEGTREKGKISVRVYRREDTTECA